MHICTPFYEAYMNVLSIDVFLAKMNGNFYAKQQLIMLKADEIYHLIF
jgi:hypothetical protein